MLNDSLQYRCSQKLLFFILQTCFKVPQTLANIPWRNIATQHTCCQREYTWHWLCKFLFRRRILKKQISEGMDEWMKEKKRYLPGYKSGNEIEFYCACWRREICLCEHIYMKEYKEICENTLKETIGSISSVLIWVYCSDAVRMYQYLRTRILLV